MTTFNVWFQRKGCKLAVLALKSKLAWAWNAGLEQGARLLEDLEMNPDPSLSRFDHLRNLKCRMDVITHEFLSGGLRTESPRRFIVAESASPALNRLVAGSIGKGPVVTSAGGAAFAEVDSVQGYREHSAVAPSAPDRITSSQEDEMGYNKGAESSVSITLDVEQLEGNWCVSGVGLKPCSASTREEAVRLAQVQVLRKWAEDLALGELKVAATTMRFIIAARP